jgi:hypothetical protein
LETVISEQISDDMIKKIAINETLEPIVKGIEKLYEDNYVALNTEGEASVLKVEEKNLELQESLDKALSDTMDCYWLKRVRI